MKKILAILIALLMVATLVACGDDISDENSLDTIKSDEKVFSNNNVGTFTYDVSEDGHYEITGYDLNTATPHEVIIPESIDDVLVTSIADDAFKSIASITSVTIPSSITTIGQFAFYDCDKLAKVTVADSVASIGAGAFSECDILTSITLPKNLAEISDQLFWNCTTLAEVVFPESLTVIGEGAFYNCDALTSVVIPSAVTEIKKTAFYGCDALTSVTVPESVTTIGEAAFAGCKADKVVFSAKADSYFASYFAEAFAPNGDEYAHYEFKAN